MDLKINKFVVIVSIIAGFGGFLFGYDASVIADIKDQAMEQLSLSNWQWSKIVSSSLLGAMLGIPLSGFLADWISRRSLLKIVALGFITGTLLCAHTSHVNTLLLGRFIIGVCIGIASYATPLFIAEIAPKAKRGSLILINGLAITFGQAIAYLIGYLLHDFSIASWRILLLIGIIPALVLFIGMFFVPDSPYWLLKHKGKEAVLHVLNKIRPKGSDILSEFNEIAALTPKTPANFRLLFTPPIFFVLLLGIGLGVFQQFSGINAIMYYGPVIFKSAGFIPAKNAILATFWVGVLNFLFTVVTVFWIDKFGRRFLLLTGTFLAGLSLFGASFFFYLHLPSQKYAILFSLSLFVIGYCISVGSLFWVLISEIYPLKVRGLSMSIATIMQWGANFIVSLSFLEIYYNIGEVFTFALFDFMCLLAYVFIYYFVPETTNIALEKIEENLFAGKKIRNIGQVLSKQNPRSVLLSFKNSPLKE